MARSVSLLGSKCRGRIGDKTYYVRHGQQIMYERNRRIRKYTSKRHYELSDTMKLAQRWRKQLLEYGVVVNIKVLLDWIYSAQRVADGGNAEELYTRNGGTWSLEYVQTTRNNITTSIWIRDAALGSERRQPWGTGWLYNPGWNTTHVADRVENVYPSGCMFLSVVGRGLNDADLVVGVREDWKGAVFAATRAGSNQRLFAGVLTSNRVGYVYPTNPMPNAASRLYTINGWQPPAWSIGENMIFAWAIIGADGIIYEMAVAPSGV